MAKKPLKYNKMQEKWTNCFIKSKTYWKNPHKISFFSFYYKNDALIISFVLSVGQAIYLD